MQPAGQRGDALAKDGPMQQAKISANGQRQILGDTQGGGQLKVLVHHTNSYLLGYPWRPHSYNLPVKANLPPVWTNQTEEYIHQRGFTRPIFSQYALNTAGRDGQRDIVQGLNRAEGFADIFQDQHDFTNFRFIRRK